MLLQMILILHMCSKIYMQWNQLSSEQDLQIGKHTTPLHLEASVYYYKKHPRCSFHS
jgi:hypothetical protein